MLNIRLAQRSRLSVVPRLWLSTSTQPPSTPRPWYVSEKRDPPPHLDNAKLGRDLNARGTPTIDTMAESETPPLPPSDAPQFLLDLHTHFSKSPFLDKSKLLITRPPSRPIGPPRPFSAPQGRRKRGGSDHGEGVGDPASGLWEWFMMVQVKEGTEGRGAIDYVVKSARALLREKHPMLPLPARQRTRGNTDGWYLMDVGGSAIQIVSKTAREKWFNDVYGLKRPDEETSEGFLNTFRRRRLV